MSVNRTVDFLLSITDYFRGHWEDPEWGRRPETQLLIALVIRELVTKIEDADIRQEFGRIADRIVSENSQRLDHRQTRDTPLNDFLARLGNPETLEAFRRAPDEILDKANLTDGERWLLTTGNRGRLRITAIKELERAGYAPLVSDRFNLTAGNIETTVLMQSTDIDVTHIDVTRETTHTSSELDFTRSSIEAIDSAIEYVGAQTFDKAGSLIVAGSGIRAIVDMTAGAEAQIRSADKVLYCVADPVTERRIHRLNPNSESLYALYGNGKPRIETYREMVNVILGNVRMGLKVCAVFYGHPGVFAWSTHKAIRAARREGHRAEMQPAVSAEASLFADLGIDPSTCGLQSFESTDFLVRSRSLDTTCHVLLWQLECVGDFGFNFSGYKRQNFPVLLERLRELYPANHPAIVYDGSQMPHLAPTIQKLDLSSLSSDHLSGVSTLYLPPRSTPEVSLEMCKRLGCE